jgi:hypothetical protein
MYHYRVKMPAWEDTRAGYKEICGRLKDFNAIGKGHYLMFDSGDETEMRFIFVSERELDAPVLSEIHDIFNVEITAEPISIENINAITAKKIDAIKSNMADFPYSGCQASLMPTETLESTLEYADTAAGSTKYKEFFKDFAGYIDRTAEEDKKAIYNVALIDNSGTNILLHLSMLYLLYAAKGLIIEPIYIIGSCCDALETEKETGFMYIIDDWDLYDDDVKIYKELFEKIRGSQNIYITLLSQKEYDTLSKTDYFEEAFPNIVTIDELTETEKAEIEKENTEVYLYLNS